MAAGPAGSGWGSGRRHVCTPPLAPGPFSASGAAVASRDPCPTEAGVEAGVGVGCGDVAGAVNGGHRGGSERGDAFALCNLRAARQQSVFGPGAGGGGKLAKGGKQALKIPFRDVSKGLCNFGVSPYLP